MPLHLCPPNPCPLEVGVNTPFALSGYPCLCICLLTKLHNVSPKKRCKSVERNLTLDRLTDGAEHFEASSVGEWSWLHYCSPFKVVWHMQCFALLLALRHWSKKRALTGLGNKTRNKGTNDFYFDPSLTFTSAGWLQKAISSSHFIYIFFPHPPTPSITFSLVRLTKIFLSKAMKSSLETDQYYGRDSVIGWFHYYSYYSTVMVAYAKREPQHRKHWQRNIQPSIYVGYNSLITKFI